MKSRRFWLAVGVVAFTIPLTILLIAIFGAQAPPAAAEVMLPETERRAPALAPQAEGWVIFPPGNWPVYAQEEITLNPALPVAGQPTELCAEVLNTDDQASHSAIVAFSVANFGIGVPFEPVGEAGVTVPPGGSARGCVMWVPPVTGHWCIQVILMQADVEPQRSQRNIDIWERLLPGEDTIEPFPVGPFPEATTVKLEMVNLHPGWQAWVEPPLLELGAGQVGLGRLHVIPPVGEPLGSRELIVDVEGYNVRSGALIGGFRKLDWPPVLLHRGRDPIYAESEISVWPYPPRAGEPTEICAELVNTSEVPQVVAVQFSRAAFGIGLPFAPISEPMEVAIPPGATQRVCITWVPPEAGHFCVQVQMQILGEIPYRLQLSQRNMDVNEPLKPRTAHSRTFLVGNPRAVAATISLGMVPHLEGWGLELSADVLRDMKPGEVREVTLTVTPPGDLPPDGTPIVDVEAYIEGERIGGFRKIYRPPVPLHRFPDPSYAEREITVDPYPPRASEPTKICVDLYNPTTAEQKVNVQFMWAAFGIGLPWTPMDGLQAATLPPMSAVRACINWVPPVGGHVCLGVRLLIEGYAPQWSQRNIDIDEPLVPGAPHTLVFNVGNPLDQVATIRLGLIPHQPGWTFELAPMVLPEMAPGEVRPVELKVTPPAGVALPAENTVIVDVEAYAEDVEWQLRLIGGFRKVFRPPVPLHRYPDPVYAEREITVEPYPPRAGEPTQVCVELRNPTAVEQKVGVQFAWAAFGIGLPFMPIDGPREVVLPPYSVVKECIMWVPPVGGHLCVQVELTMGGYLPQRSQRNLDVNEPLAPLTPHSMAFPVGNPLDHTVTIVLGVIPRLDGWSFALTLPDGTPGEILPNVAPGQIREVLLTVKPPAELPPDGTPIVDIEAYAEGRLIGGFRKVFRPPVPIHRPRDPIYAESEISIQPYPPRAFEPTEVAVEVRNPTEEPQLVTVVFSAAEFGIGLPFTPIHEPVVVEVPPLGIARPAIMWVPPHGGLWCIEVGIEIPRLQEVFISRRNIDVGEPLEPNVPHSRIFVVRNPLSRPVTITLGLIPHLPDWGLELSPDVLPSVKPGEAIEVMLTVTPPEALPDDGAVIVDVEAYAEGELIGGFRKIFRPPVPIHRPRDPIYAESEIGVDPYPVIPGQPVKLSVEVFNPTDEDRLVAVTFSVAFFGIGLPFSTADIAPNPIVIFVPRLGAATGHVLWTPPLWEGKFCVRVTLKMEGYEAIWSQRNIDVGEPLKPGVPHALVFPVGAWPYTEPATVTLGLRPHLEGWGLQLSQDVLPAVQPGQQRPVTLTVTPPVDAELGTGLPIVDVEAFVNGELIGGFRKLDRAPVPLHKPHERGYAESEIVIDPYPPQVGVDSQVSTVVQNTSSAPMTVSLAFGWADFGLGIPFTTTGMTPALRTVTLAPGTMQTATVTWKPVQSGHQCVQIQLSDVEGVYEPQLSQRNVDVAERPPCNTAQVYTFTVYNNTPLAATVETGLVTFNVPAEWVITVTPSPTLTLPAWGSGVVTVKVLIPCPPLTAQYLAGQAITAIQEAAGSIPTIDVEGYVDGELVGGIEIQLVAPEAVSYPVYVPLLLRNW